MVYQKPAFPTAQGAGAYSVGGRGGTIYKVTNLNDSGAGSFREACEATGPRIIIFDVAGYIDVRDTINIDSPYCSILGQTAPGHGITLRSHSIAYNETLLQIRTHNVIVRYIRTAAGPERIQSHGIMILYARDEPTNPDRVPHDIIIDHCTMRWCTDTNASVYNSNFDRFGDNEGVALIERVTWQWCFFCEPYDDLWENNHAYNLALGFGCDNISVHHCLFASARGRNPRCHSETIEFVNNVIFNCISLTQCGGSPDKWAQPPTKLNYINNREIWGNNTASNFMIKVGESQDVCTDPLGEKAHEIYVSGNAGHWKTWPGGDEWDVVGCWFGAGSPASDRWQVFTPATIVGGIPITTDSIFTATNRILAHGGCKMPTCFGRDKADRRIVRAVQLHGGKVPGSTIEEVGGWPTLSPGYPQPTDTDGDGVWDWFETANGSNPAVADSDDYDYDGAGAYEQPYTNIEVFENVHNHGDPHVLTYVDVN